MPPLIQSNQFIIWAVIAAYLLIITFAGSYYSKYMRTADAYFRGDNLIPWWAAGISIYMANFTAYTFVAIASLVYIDGLAGIILETGPALVYLIVAVVFARIWHRLNVTSPPEYLEARFNPLTRQVFSILGIATTFVASGMRLYAMSKLAESLIGVPLVWAITITGAVIILYTMLGGLWAVIVTDVVQFIVLLLAVIPLFIISVSAIFVDSSWAEFVSRIPAGYASFPSAEHGRDFGWLAAFWFAYLLDLGGDWGTIQRLNCTPTEREARRGAYLAMALSIPHAVVLLGPVFIARVLWAGEIADPNVVGQAESVYGKVALKLLPAGMIGVVVAAMFSATMSTLSVAWSVRGASFVNDLYARFLRPRADDREKILAGRLAVLLIGGTATTVAVVVALTSTGLFALAQGVVGLVVIPLVLPLMLGLFIRRAASWAGLAGMGACLLFAVVNRWGYAWIGRDAPFSFEAEMMVSALLAAAVMFGSGFLSRSAEEAARAERFLARTRHARAPQPVSQTLPSPLGVIGAFTMLIGALVALLVAFPQSAINRAVTFASALALLGCGWMMRRHSQDASSTIEPAAKASSAL
jgi:SSS family transporter